MLRSHFDRRRRQGEVELGWELGGRLCHLVARWLKVLLASRRCDRRPGDAELALEEDGRSVRLAVLQLPHLVGFRGDVVLVLGSLASPRRPDGIELEREEESLAFHLDVR